MCELNLNVATFSNPVNVRTAVIVFVVVVIIVVVVVIVVDSTAADQTGANHHNIGRMSKALLRKETPVVSILDGKNFDHF
jgi:ABC-type transport system involved in cytochrome bd biosynthesis fused ATPase/permease subunit